MKPFEIWPDDEDEKDILSSQAGIKQRIQMLLPALDLGDERVWDAELFTLLAQLHSRSGELMRFLVEGDLAKRRAEGQFRRPIPGNGGHFEKKPETPSRGRPRKSAAG